ncbi:AAA family ATPase [Francisella tularensis subsp. holarctica]|uniref:AAA domain protein n=1 Tax=Francisella tularensis subsp. holarctica (strain LVS) TaxID=376619 RepID=A0AAI8BID5_FRATH|nr:AAA family ATPase [Francisella tularensis]EBA52564.1 hypothetical protein FTHG_00929 [Francisella tularensis subsp. holarctica 257]AFT92785.1 hypothetical protein FTS_0959 [Francisella tularensis subsp. holarctica FSC200]AJI51650.1 AAA domain protein [Francisella tularensis subsp. holarctica]AJI59401.1 AAA domain protein [Francisella tularensis subsp. holarctica LVS]AJI64141.1 AAA domain protein [Francisella tularensis subsp. holarctica]
MKITRLKIKGYKNLDIDIKHESNIMAFIRLNGSGKSNVLEALSFIFREIYKNKQEDILKKVCKNILFEFEIYFKTQNSEDSTYRFIGKKGNFTFSN